MPSPATTVAEYLKNLPEERRKALSEVRAVIRKNLGKGYKEGIQYGMIGYFVPHSVYPPGYHCKPEEPLPFMSLASQKNHMAVYLMCVYGDAKLRKSFEAAWKKTGKKLDMGKSCVRFKRVEDLALDVIGAAVASVPVGDYIAQCESNMPASARRAGPTRKPSPTGKRSPSRKA